MLSVFYPGRSSYLLLGVAALLSACQSDTVLDPERYGAVDRVAAQIQQRVRAAEALREVTQIDHARLAAEAGSPMPPARVLIFSDAQLETQLIGLNPLTALDLPLRVLAFDNGTSDAASFTYNSFDYLASRYQLDPQESASVRARYNEDFQRISSGLPRESQHVFANNEMQPDGIVTLESPFGFEETLRRVNAAIDAQDDTVHFGFVDFQANAEELGYSLPPSYMILFGGPGPGGKAMAGAPTLGLDAFCQKFLIWQDNDGATFLSFNDLLVLADRQGVKKSPALRVVNFRLKKTFSEALEKG
jgi:uncharacterized protein (DUF302 family)